MSNPIPYANYTPDVLLVRSANLSTSPSDGDFGNLGQGGLGATGTGFTVVSGTTVTLYSFNATTGTSTPVAAGGSGQPPGAPDRRRDHAPGRRLPGLHAQPGQCRRRRHRIYDIYGNQLDGEILGNPTSQNSPGIQAVQLELDSRRSTRTSCPTAPSGQENERRRRGRRGVHDGFHRRALRQRRLRPARLRREPALAVSTLSNGSLANPYPVLAPEGNPNSSLASNPTHDPNLGLNNPAFFQPSNSNLSYDFSGDGKFEQSAFYAASQLAYKRPRGRRGRGRPAVAQPDHRAW